MTNKCVREQRWRGDYCTCAKRSAKKARHQTTSDDWLRVGSASVEKRERGRRGGEREGEMKHTIQSTMHSGGAARRPVIKLFVIHSADWFHVGSVSVLVFKATRSAPARISDAVL